MDVLLTNRKAKRARTMRNPALLPFKGPGYSRMTPDGMPMLSRAALLDLATHLPTPRGRRISHAAPARIGLGRIKTPYGMFRRW